MPPQIDGNRRRSRLQQELRFDICPPSESHSTSQPKPHTPGEGRALVRREECRVREDTVIRCVEGRRLASAVGNGNGHRLLTLLCWVCVF